MGIETAIIGSALLGTYGANKQAKAATNAAQTQYQATQDASKQQREMFDILNAQQAPYREAGYGALNQINTMLPEFTKQFTSEDLIRNLDPSYKFMLEQGLGATGQAMNVGGGGSNVDLARQKFAQEYAKTGAQQAFNNYTNQQSNIYNRLSNLAGIGQAAQSQSNTLGSNTANALSQLGIGGASALGAGQVGAANAMAGAYGNIGNNFMLSQLLTPQTTGSTGGITAGGATTMNPGLNPYFAPYNPG
jgi:uncharacterized membrane protein YccC